MNRYRTYTLYNAIVITRTRGFGFAAERNAIPFYKFSFVAFFASSARIAAPLDEDPRVIDFRVKIRHEESLHPHDAVAVITKGVPGGLTA